MSHRDDASAAAAPSEWQSCDARLLDRLLFKYRNQHRKTPYFQKLKQVRRAIRVTEQMMQTESHATGASSAESLVHSLVRAQRIILHCSRPLYALLSQTYFMSFALAALALLARLYATNRSKLMTRLEQCLQSRIVQQAEADASPAAGSSVAECLHRALRTEQGEHEWLEEAAAVDDMFATHSASTLHANSDPAATLSGGALGTVPSSAVASAPDEGDSDEDDEVTTVPAAAASLPSQLKFFASPAAPKPAKPQSSVAVPAAAAPKSMVVKQPSQSTPSQKQSGQKRPAAVALLEDDDDEEEEGTEAQSDLEDDEDDEPVAAKRSPMLSKPSSAARPATQPIKPIKPASASSPPAARPATAPSKATAAAKRPSSAAAPSSLVPRVSSAASPLPVAPATANKKAKLTSAPSAALSSSPLALFSKLQTGPAATARPLSSIAATSAASQPASLKKKLKKKTSLASAGSMDEMDDIFG